jgi:hypothetical protein
LSKEKSVRRGVRKNWTTFATFKKIVVFLTFYFSARGGGGGGGGLEAVMCGNSLGAECIEFMVKQKLREQRQRNQ